MILGVELDSPLGAFDLKPLKAYITSIVQPQAEAKLKPVVIDVAKDIILPKVVIAAGAVLLGMTLCVYAYISGKREPRARPATRQSTHALKPAFAGHGNYRRRSR